VNRSRVECDYVIPTDSEGAPIGEYLLNEDYEFRMSTVQYDRPTESFYLHARMRRTTDRARARARALHDSFFRYQAQNSPWC
jgi:hypothetical protein